MNYVMHKLFMSTIVTFKLITLLKISVYT